MHELSKKKRGAPRGNQNARKHGFYSTLLTEEDKSYLNRAALIDGLDDEIALLRVKLRSVVEQDSGNVRLISQAAVSLARLLRTQHQIGKKDDTLLRWQKALENVYNDIARPIGVSAEQFFHRVSQNPGPETKNQKLETRLVPAPIIDQGSEP